MAGFQVLLDAPETPSARLEIATPRRLHRRPLRRISITTNVASWQRNLDKLPGGRALIDLDYSADRSPRRIEAAGWIPGVCWD